MKRLIILLAVIITIFSSAITLEAVERVPRITDREIIERLIRLEEGQKRIEQEMVSLRAEIKDVRGEIENVREDLRGEIKDLRREMKEFLLWGFGVTFAGIFMLIGFVIWDRRTAIAPVIRQTREMEKREELTVRALKEYAREEPRLAEILKSLGLL